MTEEQTEDITARQLEEINRALSRRKISFYKPYPKQMEFHNASSLIPKEFVSERLLIAANQVGKCVTFQSLIEHPDGTATRAGTLFRDGTPFWVKGWDGEHIVAALAVEPIEKPAEPCVRLWRQDGRWIECALNHRILLETGEYAFCHEVAASLPTLRVSNLEYDLLTRILNEPRWKKRVANFLADCLRGLRLCDGRLLRVQEIVVPLSPLRGGVLTHSLLSSETDGCCSTHTNTLSPVFSHQSNPDATVHFAALVAGYSRRVGSSFVGRMRRYIQDASRRLLASILRLRSIDATLSDSTSQVASHIPFSIDGNRIVAYELIGSHKIYDFSVPATHNYVSCGMVHHNTFSAGAEVAMHSTGIYPPWFKGRRFAEPTNGWVGSETGQFSRDVAQNILLGEVGEWGTGAIPGNLIVDIKKAVHGSADQVDTILVKYKTGGVSRIGFKTYDQGRVRWQGKTQHYVWLDEECDMDIYSEAKTRVQAKAGLIFLTFTPLKGMSEVVLRFLKEKPVGTHVTTMSIYDAKHYTKEQADAIIAGFPEHQRDARAFGIPMLGEGAVFPFSESLLKEPIMQIPAFWPRIAGIDIGYDHPTAVAWLAWDRDTDIVHVYDTYRLKKETALTHSNAIKSRGVWIPVAWPHDAHQHDKGSGKVIAEQYRKEGVNMMRTHATHPPTKTDMKEGAGGTSFEAGIQEMLNRIQTGRLKVASHLEDWFEEYRMYHREKGMVVKERDDLMSATRIGIMMLRFARVYTPPSSAPSMPKFVPSDRSMGVLG